MKTYKVGLIRVLTTEDEELLQLHGKLIESYFPMFQVVSRCIPDQPEGIHDDETFAVGVPKVVNLAVELWKEGCQAIIISCAGDPGVPEARQAVPIPVIGAGSSTAALSLFFGSHPAVLGITEDVPSGYRGQQSSRGDARKAGNHFRSRCQSHRRRSRTDSSGYRRREDRIYDR